MKSEKKAYLRVWGVAVYIRNDVGGCRHCRCKEEGIKIKLAYQWVWVVVVTFDTDGWWRWCQNSTLAGTMDD